MAAPLPSNFSCLFLTVQVVWSETTAALMHEKDFQQMKKILKEQACSTQADKNVNKQVKGKQTQTQVENMCQSALGQIRLKPGPKMGEINSEGALKTSAVMTYTNSNTVSHFPVKFIYSEKATKFCEISFDYRTLSQK